MFLSLSCLLVLHLGAICGELHINSASDLISFSDKVNSGSTFKGITVLLDTDIVFTKSLSEKFEPIGYSNSFKGRFGGQGYIISGLALNFSSTTSKPYIGLFGYTKEATIRNVVLDSSNAITGKYKSSSSTTYIGGVVGCFSNGLIENVVNLASVTFTDG